MRGTLLKQVTPFASHKCQILKVLTISTLHSYLFVTVAVPMMRGLHYENVKATSRFGGIFSDKHKPQALSRPKSARSNAVSDRMNAQN